MDEIKQRNTVHDTRTFETSDIYLAAYLRHSGLHFLGHRTTRGKRMLFLLRATDMLPDLLKAYEQGNGRVPAKALRDNVRDIKAIVKTAQNAPESI